VKYPHGTERVAGILVPVAALRSGESVGCGEFADLPALAQWCRETGLGVIQLLPVNDTGGESSPYSALSAYALHPLYIRIADLPELATIPERAADAIHVALEQLRVDHETTARFDYHGMIVGKMNLLRTVFEDAREEILTSSELQEFVRSNPWVQPYSVFRALKERYHQRSWTQWDDHREITPRTMTQLWDDRDLVHSTRFYAWLQLRLAGQFRTASEAVAAAGIALKGDIPILMNEDSADAWFHRDVFRPDLRAGAPPDMFSELGQNWGFPIYNWHHLEKDDFEWWRERLRQAARYYHAYRIDHVLGFFRIWAIPAANFSGILGFFWPQDGIPRVELEQAGFDEGRIRWLCEPHITGGALREVFGADAEKLEGPVLRRIGDQDLFLFAEEVAGETDILALAEAEAASENGRSLELTADQRDWLLWQYRDRALMPMPDGTLATTWTYRECSRYRELGDDERGRFEALAAGCAERSNTLWAEHGRRLLRFMRDTTDMLTCAEDLGVVPEAVPRVLKELDVLSLRIPRWSHYWERPGEPLIPLDEYPEASVCAPSVHDTSTMRDWWRNESGREQLWDAIGMDGPCPTTFDPATARAVLRAFMGCTSRLVILQIQDLLALTPELVHANPEQERINIPGTSNSFNWTWRMPVTIDALRGHPVLTGEIQALAASR
jgi:4-alpha-glucanotransferase